MTDSAKGLLDKGKPWRSDVKWPVVAFEAVALIAIGIYMLVDTDRAADWLLQLIGLVFLFVSLQLAWNSLRGEVHREIAFSSFRAGIGVTVGSIASSLWWSEYVAIDAVRIILGWGLVAFAALQLVSLVLPSGREEIDAATLATTALTLVLGILLLSSNETTAEGRIQFLGVVLLAFGILLGALAFVIRNQANSTAR